MSDRDGQIERAARALAPFLPDEGASESERWILWERGVALAKQLRSALARPRDEVVGGETCPRCPECGHPVTIWQSQLPTASGAPRHKSCHAAPPRPVTPDGPKS